MGIRHVDSLKKDFDQICYFIRRLEKDGELDKIPIFQEKLKLVAEAINSIESKSITI